jgi:hypothetical protein
LTSHHPCKVPPLTLWASYCWLLKNIKENLQFHRYRSGETIGDSSSTTFLSGEHFIANPRFTYNSTDNQTLIRQERPHYNLSVLRFNEGLRANINSLLTTVNVGYPCTMSSDFMSCSFDAAALFPKIKQSGNAALWSWQCEYVPYHTLLQNYEVHEDSTQGTVIGGQI